MNETVLVADDSKTIRQIVEMALKASTWQVVGVDNAQDAMQAARQSPSVILLDYYMPDGSGYDVCRALKSDSQTNSIPIVMLGGSYKNFDEALARQAGADEVLMKPFKTDALIGVLETAQQNGAAAAPSAPEPSEPSEPVYEAPSPEPEPVYEAPTPEPEPVATPTPTPTPNRQEDATPMPSASSQPRIPSKPARSASKPDITTGSTPGAQTQSPASGSSSAASGVSRAEIEALVKEEVKSAVRAELPALLRNVMGEIFQQKVLPKLMEHAEARIKAVVNENLTGQIQKQVRVELERLLEE